MAGPPDSASRPVWTPWIAGQNGRVIPILLPRDQRLLLLDQHMVLVGDLLQQFVRLPCFADRLLTSAFMPKTAKGRKNQSTVSKLCECDPVLC